MMEINLKVRVIFYSYENGGRRSPVTNNYRVSILFGLTKSQANRKGRLPFKDSDFSLNNSGTFKNFTEEPKFNTEIQTILTFKDYYDRLKPFFKPKEHFIIFEASKIVGKGVIEEVFEISNLLLAE